MRAWFHLRKIKEAVDLALPLRVPEPLRLALTRLFHAFLKLVDKYLVIMNIYLHSKQALLLSTTCQSNFWWTVRTDTFTMALELMDAKEPGLSPTLTT